jgi:hypothetical protein
MRIMVLIRNKMQFETEYREKNISNMTFSDSFGAHGLFSEYLGGPKLPERKPQMYTFHSL